jgi:DNA-binding beta-propeller fold protein YncE
MMPSFKAQNLAGALLLLLCAACGDAGVSQPASLSTPRAFTVASGSVCMTSEAPFDGAVRPVLRRCADNEEGAIGLVANQTSDSVGVVDMTRDMRGSPPVNPRLVDLDPSVPGVTHIKVGRSPVDVAAGQGTTAYAVNQADASVSVINLTVLKALDTPIIFDEAPKEVVVTPPPADADGTGTLAVALSNPSRLWLHDELDCAFPETDADGFVTDRANALADAGCDSVPTQADGQTIDLAGSVSDMVVGPQGERIYVVYSDANFASVIALDETALADFEDGCIDGGQAPCEAARIGLTFDCSNGVDDDGDGLVDRVDPQCFGPRGAESPDGIGRDPLGACSNGMDDDEDGLVDREDPDCLVSGADSEETPIVEDVTLACMDERDNDGDGAIDYPADPACYGDVGRTEKEAPALGFASASIDQYGNFLYVADRTNGQVLVVDATRLDLIDAFDAGGRDRSPFSNRVGIGVPASPMAVEARVDERVIWCETDDCVHGITRYTYGAWVVTDGGYAYNLNAMTTYCEFNTDDGLNIEEECLAVPEFPISYDADACTGDGAEDLEGCLGERVNDLDAPSIAFNPNFELNDAAPRESRVRGLGTCETPRELVSSIRAASDGPADVSCTSPLRPQPVAPQDADGFAGTSFERADLLTESTATLTNEASDVILQLLTSIDDQAVIAETWSVTYEGVIPDTNRDDGVVSEEPGTLTAASLDMCDAGVQEGDYLTIVSEPTGSNGCDAFVSDDAGTLRTWAIDEVRPDRLVLSVIDEEGDEDNFADELPSRSCFNTGVRFEVRGSDEWIVVGGRTGFLSQRRSLLGTCQPRYGADQPRFSSRVETGALFEGPYLSFVLRAGVDADGEEIAPQRGLDEELSYRFSTERNFNFDRFRTTTALPTQLLVDEQPSGPRFMIIPDPASNFVYIRNLNLSGDQAAFLLQ